MIEPIVTEALLQAPELLELDAPRAEAWASDLLALASESGPDGPGHLVAALVADGSAGAAAALHAVASIDPALTAGVEILGPAPVWVGALGPSTCDGAWLLRAGRGASGVLGFVAADESRHLITVDLEPGSPECVGEIVVAPGELLEVLDEDDAGVDVDVVDPVALATRIASAVEATDRPRPSAVANGRLLAARLMGLLGRRIEPPSPADDVIPELAPRDADDDAFARDVLLRAIAGLPSPDVAATAAAAEALRAAAQRDEVLAQWVAASVGPVDLDGPDLDVVLAALATAVAPGRLGPLGGHERHAVVELEWADWLGAVIGLVRAGEGAAADPIALVDLVNRCPEVTTTIPKSDRARVAEAFAVCTDAWPELGVTDDGRLTPFGVAVLPLALDRAWSASEAGRG